MGTWKQAANNITTYPPFELHRWKLKDNVLATDWDSDIGCGCKKNNVQSVSDCTPDNYSNHPFSQQVSIPEDRRDSESEISSESGECDDVDAIRNLFLVSWINNTETFTL